MENSVSNSKVVLVVILSIFIFNIVHAVNSVNSWSPESSKTKIFVETLGYVGFAYVSECTTTRNPIIEPICLPDIPGGYCYHEACGLVAPIFIGKEYSLEVLPRE